MESAAGIVTRLQTKYPRSRTSIAGRGKKFIPSVKHPTNHQFEGLGGGGVHFSNGENALEVMLINHPYLVPMLRMSGLHIHFSIHLHGFHRDNFTVAHSLNRDMTSVR